jgi:3-isopropylmalate/(R)-2-methylmalate dehydratase small subunit
MIVKGRVWKFGNSVDTDSIIPGRFLNVSDREALSKNCFSDLRPDFTGAVRPGDIIVAATNFGCGSSREHAPWALKAAGISVIIAKSFARIFYRNAFNIGLPILESKEAYERFAEGDRVSVDLTSGELRDLNKGTCLLAKPLPDFMREIIRAGGLVDHIKEKGSLPPPGKSPHP